VVLWRSSTRKAGARRDPRDDDGGRGAGGARAGHRLRPHVRLPAAVRQGGGAEAGGPRRGRSQGRAAPRQRRGHAARGAARRRRRQGRPHPVPLRRARVQPGIIHPLLLRPRAISGGNDRTSPLLLLAVASRAVAREFSGSDRTGLVVGVGVIGDVEQSCRTHFLAALNCSSLPPQRFTIFFTKKSRA
jgi:hypothetical protein